MKLIRRITCIVLLAVAALPLAVRAAPLKIAYSDWPGWVAWEVANQKGWLKDAGVDVEFLWFEYGPRWTPLLRARPTPSWSPMATRS